MASLQEYLFDSAKFSATAEAALATSLLLVKYGTTVEIQNVVVTAAVGDYPRGRADHLQATAGGAVRCHALVGGQMMRLQSDGNVTADALICPDAAGQATDVGPTAADVVIGQAIETQGTQGTAFRIAVLSPFRYAAT